MFELPTLTTLKLRKTSPRKEHHGDQLVQAVDLDLEWETSNEHLALFDGYLLYALYWRSGETVAQADIEGVPSIAPNLRMPHLEMPLKWELELIGRDLTIDPGLGGKSMIVLATCTAKKFRLTCKEGGTVVIGFQVQCNTEITEKIVGKLCALEGGPVQATLTTSEEPEVQQASDKAGLLPTVEGDAPWPFAQ